MKNITFLTRIVFGLIVGCGFIACDNDELNSKELLVFMRNWTDAPFDVTINYQEDGSSVITGKEKLEFPLYLTREATVDVSVDICVDEGLIEAYNKDHNTSYTIFPQDRIHMSSNKVLISAGSLRSSDSIVVDFDYQTIKAGEYLLPVRVGDVKSVDKGIRASTTAGVIYYRFEVTEDNVNEANLDVPTGKKIDRGNWIITCTDEPNQSFPITNLIDGNKLTNWQGTRLVKSPIVVDMGQEHTLKGFSFYHGGAYYDAPCYFQVYVSQDGEQWMSYGTAGRYLFSNSIKEKEYGLNFFVPVSCRYFKLVVDGVISSYFGARFSELDAIE